MADRAPLDAFLERFVLPLLTGGPVHVQGVLSPATLKGFVAERAPDATLVTRVCEAMTTRLARIGPVTPVGALPMDAVGLCAVWHNLLALTHPEARGSVRLRRKVRAWCEAMLLWADVPRTRAEVSLRHAVLGRLEVLGRVDTHVTFWAGFADFVGVPPPKALVAWPNLRRVEESRRRVDLAELLRGLELGVSAGGDDDLLPVARAALAASPLTDLALADRPSFVGFAWGPPLLNALSDPCLRGAAQRIVLRKGTPSLRAVEAATLSLCRAEGTPGLAAGSLLRFHLELLLTDALSGRGTSGPPAPAQPVAMDAFVRLGHARVAAFLDLDEDLLRRTLPPDPSRPVPRDPPSAPLLQRAGLMEVRS